MKYFYHFIILTSISLTSISFGAQDCSLYVGSCEYYLCREMYKKCGFNSYFINFGYKYCTKSFKKLATEVSSEGKSWIGLTATCLQEQLEEIDDSASCAEIKNKATKGHSICYNESHFCSLDVLDKLKIMKMLTPTIQEQGVFLEGIQVFSQCLHEQLFNENI